MQRIKQLIKKEQPQGYKGDGSRYFQCPFCNGRKKLEVDHAKPIWYCHKCGLGGSLDEYNKATDRRPITGLVIPDDEHGEVLIGRNYSPAPRNSIQWKYLSKDRRLSDECIRELRPHTGPSAARVYFPFYELGGSRPVYFIGRAIFPCFDRYSNPTTDEFPYRKSEVLWGLHRITSRVDQVIVCEGVLSACGLSTGVACLGKTLSTRQIEILQRIEAREIIICFDGFTKRATTNAAMKLAKHTTSRVSIVRLPDAKDPDECRDEMDKYLKQRERVA